MKILKQIVTLIFVVTLFSACGNDNKFDPLLSINGNNSGVNSETVTSLYVYSKTSNIYKYVYFYEYDELGNITYESLDSSYIDVEDDEDDELDYVNNITYEYNDNNHIISGTKDTNEQYSDPETIEFTYEYEYGDQDNITKLAYIPDTELNSKQTTNFTYETDSETGDITVTATYDYSFGTESESYDIFGEALPYEDTYIFTKDGVIKEHTSIGNYQPGYSMTYTLYSDKGHKTMMIRQSGYELSEATLEGGETFHYDNYYDEAGYLYGVATVKESSYENEDEETITSYTLYSLKYYNTNYADGSISIWTDEDDDYFFADIDCDDTDADYFKPEVEACDESNDKNTIKFSSDDADMSGTSVGNDDSNEDSTETCTSFKYVCSGKDMDNDGFTEADGDCDDTDYNTNPDGYELCDGKDNNCDGEIDEGVTDMYTWYVDSDGDGWGSTDEAVDSCVQPEDYVSNSGDCNDDIYSVYNTDCGEEEPPVTTYTYYRDSDGDGYGNPYSSTEAESQPSGYVTNDDDCNDSDDGIHPDRKDCAEFGVGKYLSLGGDGVDNDCDGYIDEDTCELQLQKAPKFKG